VFLAVHLETNPGGESVRAIAALLLLEAKVPTFLSASHSQAPSNSGWPGCPPTGRRTNPVPASRLLDGADQVTRLDRATRVTLTIEAQGAPEVVLAQLVAQHVQHATALLVQVSIEEIDGNSYWRQKIAR